MQVSPGGEHIERVTNLSIPTVAPTIGEDAQKRITGGLGKVIAAGATLELSESSGQQAGVVRFQQTAKVGNKVLPVWDATTSFFYTKGDQPKLRAIISNAQVPGEITGSSGVLSIDDAKKIAARQLRVDEAEFVSGEEGVKVLPSDPTRARVSVRLLLPAGEQQKNLEIFVDGETRRVFTVE